MAQARLQLQASEAAAHQAEVEAAAAEATEADAAALDELQAALDAAREAMQAAGFVPHFPSDNTTQEFRYTMEDAANWDFWS